MTAEEFAQRWQRPFRLVFDSPAGFYGVQQWTDMVFQPGYTFSFLDRRESDFPDENDYARLVAFAREVGDRALLALYPAMARPDLAEPEFLGAALVSTSASWLEMRAATTAGSERPSDVAPLTFDLGFSDFYVWSPRAVWGVAHSSDGEVAIVGTWGSEATAAFRRTFGLTGDGWTERLEEGYGSVGSGAGKTGPPITDLYRRA